MKTIIAPVDFSSVSNNACLYAAKMAEDLKAKLILLHVMELPATVAEFPVSEDVYDEIGMEKELKKLKNKLLTETNNKINIQTENILGSVEYEIKELCEEKKPFVVIMGTHSYSVLDRFFVGSSTIYSAKNLRYPVLVIPANTKYKPISKIAIASDLKDIYKMPVAEIEMLVKTFNAKLDIFYVGKNEKRLNKNSLAGLVLDHRLVNLDPEFYFIQGEDIMKGVASLAEKHQTDLLMIIPRKHGPFHKSQSRDFIFYSSVPVLAIHENDIVQQS